MVHVISPIRLLEEIRFWKLQEQEHAHIVHELIPILEPRYVDLFQEWEKVFSQTRETASQLIEMWKTSSSDVDYYANYNAIVQRATDESAQFIEHLYAIQNGAGQLPTHRNHRSNDLMHLIRDSEYFLSLVRNVDRPLATGDETWTERLPDGQMVPIGGHTLPPLPYAYNALEPVIDEETMRIHHEKLHKKYVDELNKAEKELAKARISKQFELIKHWEGQLAFNGAGHYLHTIFFQSMTPKGGGHPTGPLAEAINKYFGSFEEFKNHFSAAAEKVEGPGWAMLVWSPRARHLEILQAEKHQNLSQQDSVPLLPLDVWEHSYFLKYKDDRRKYIDAWWNLVNWQNVSERFTEAVKLQWTPY